MLSRTLPDDFVQTVIDENEKLADQAITFNLYQQNKCTFYHHENPRNYSGDEVLNALEKNKIKKVEIIFNK